MSILSREKLRQLLSWLYNRQRWVSWKGDENLESLVFFSFGICIWDNHLTFSCFSLVCWVCNNAFKVHFQELRRTKEQSTKIPPDGNIWKAIQSGFKAMSYYCSHRALSHRVYRPRFHPRCLNIFCLTSFFPTTSKMFPRGENKRCMGCTYFVFHSRMINLELHSYIILQTVLVSIKNLNQWIVYHICHGVSL